MLSLVAGTTIRRAAIAVFAVATLVFAATACGPPTTLAVSTEVGGLDHPWDLAFLPDGRMIFTERSGKVSSWDGTTKRTLATPADVRVLGEGGMLGLAIDPAFDTNRFIYTCFVSTAPDVRLVRWHLNTAGTALDTRTDLVTGIEANPSGRHSGCRPRFGPDGFLWVGTGDAARGTNPQNPTSLNGKVLRITRNGAPATGNPGLTNPASPLDDRIYTYGHRNVQGVAFRPTDGAPFDIEHGTGCDDEINRLVAGGNYGWDPVVPGDPNGYDESQPMTDLGKFPNARPAAWSSGCPTIAPSGGTFLTGSQWSGWQETLAVAVLKDQRLQVFKIDPTTNTVTQTWTAITTQGRLRSAVEGPDGHLYIATDVDGPNGKILEVTPSTP